MRDYWSGIIDGAAGAAFLAVSAAFGFGELGFKNDENLISGIAALIAAFATVWIINRQIQAANAGVERQLKQVQMLEDERREAKRQSQRAALPGALSALILYAENESAALMPIYVGSGVVRVPTGTSLIHVPPPPTSLATLIDTIEFAKPLVGAALSQLLTDIQIFDARMQSLARGLLGSSVVTSININARVYEAIEIHARISALFPYARRQTDDPQPLTLGLGATSAQLLGYNSSTHPALFALISSRFPLSY